MNNADFGYTLIHCMADFGYTLIHCMIVLWVGSALAGMIWIVRKGYFTGITRNVGCPFARSETGVVQ